MSELISVAKFLRDDGMRTLPIACRLVPLDQWLVTHVDTSWKVKDIKQWILSKCNVWGSSGAPQPPRFRPASPVIFSAPSRRSSIDSGSWAETEEGEDKDDEWDVFAALDYNPDMRASDSGLGLASAHETSFTKSNLGGSVPEHAASTSSLYISPPLQRSSSDRGDAAVTSAQYTLVSFSNGFVLEDDADLSWYKPRPFELLEVHRAGAIVSLPRARIAAYAEPYFEGAVRVSERPHVRQRNSRNLNLDDGQAQGVEWKVRWAVVKEGVLYLCKEACAPPTHQFPIAALTALGGPEQFGPLVGGSGAGKGLMICARFSRIMAPGGKRSGGVGEEEVGGMGAGAPLQKKKKPKTSSWVVLEMPSRSAYESMLRILHRLAPHPLPSSFLPHRTPLSSPISPSTLIHPHSPPPSPSISTATSDPRALVPESGSSMTTLFGVQYPEWRLALLARARAAGRGAVGPALSLAQCHSLFTNGGEECALDQYHQTLPRAPSISESLRRRAEAASSSSTGIGTSPVEEGTRVEGTTSGGARAWKDALLEDDGDDGYGEDDIESEVEWDGWVRDLARRASRTAINVNSAPVIVQAPVPVPASVRRNDTGSRIGIISPSSPSESEADLDYDHDLYSDSRHTARTRHISYAAHPHPHPSPFHPSYATHPLPVPSPSRARSNTVSANAGSGTAFGGARYTYTSTTTTTISTYVDHVPELRASASSSVPGTGGTWPHHSSAAPASAPLPSPSPAPAVRNTPRARRVREDAPMRLTPPPSAGASGSGSRAASVSGSEISSAGDNASNVNANGSTNGRGLGGVKRIVRGVSIRNAFSTERFFRGLEDALDFVDGR